MLQLPILNYTNKLTSHYSLLEYPPLKERAVEYSLIQTSHLGQNSEATQCQQHLLCAHKFKAFG